MEKENNIDNNHINNDVLLTNKDNYIENENFNEDLEEALYCEDIAETFEPYYNKNILPFNLYIKDDLPVIFEALVELERVRPKNPVEYFCAYILEKNNINLKNQIN